MIDKSIISKVVDFLQGDIPLIQRPYALLAEQLGCTEDDVLKVISALQAQGIMRRFGAVLRHQRVGYSCNAMVAWQCPPGRADELGMVLAAYSQVSHCYQREVPDDFPYQIFTMIHAHSEEELQELIEVMASATGMYDYQVLRSVKEFKKVSMRYQVEDGLLTIDKEEN